MSNKLQVHLSTMGAGVLLMCYGKTAVKKGMVRLKAGIDEKLDALRAPEQVQTNVLKDGKPELLDVPETGPGYERHRVVNGPLILTEAEADHLKEAYDEILDKDGFPPKWARGVLEVEKALLAWSASELDEDEGDIEVE
jgi:hypothetical protein